MGEITTTLTVISCVLSIIGSVAVAATSKFSVNNNRKAGKTLLFWLSVADLFTALVYVWPVHPTKTDNYNERLCEAQAVLGIFFPVASFVWTDLVAYYIYTVVVERRTRNQAQWETELRRYHWYAWGIAAFCATLVAATRHAGSEDDHNTGGWCWVKADGTTELFVWELIGGKFVEWISIVIIVPLLYWRAWKELTRLQEACARSSESLIPPIIRYEPEKNCCGCVRLVKKPMPQISVASSMQSTDSTFLVSGMALSSDNPAPALSTADDAARVHSTGTQLSHPSTAHSFHSAPLLSTYRSPSVIRRNVFDGAQGTDFRQFFLRLGILPCIFFLGRLPGNLRMILELCGARTDASEDWLGKLQAFGDPAQGFLNALLFVVFSTEGRATLATLALLCWSWCTGKQIPLKPEPQPSPNKAYRPPDDRTMSCNSIKPFSSKVSTADSAGAPPLGDLEDGVEEDEQDEQDGADEEDAAVAQHHMERMNRMNMIDEVEIVDDPEADEVLQ